jgi:hypothetical protein
MKRATLAIVTLLLPAATTVSAQSGVTVDAKASTSASVSTARNTESRTALSTSSRAELNAMYEKAQSKGLRSTLIAQRVAEGEAKGASEAAIMTSSRRVMANLEASQSAMIKAGRTNPEPQEVERAATAMERGVTSAQIETMARRAPKERSLVVAFEVLSELSANGRPVSQALAQVQSKLDARASDGSITSLLTVGANGAGATKTGTPGRGVAGSVTGGVTGTLGGVIKKP